ncbi:MAG: ABC transporter ATP-binding protein [Acidobacteria bacterium]|nr:ABC transporter ATP-binding protein [Acidobacteriota bacterium]
MNVIEFKNVSKAFHRATGQRLLRHYLEDLLGKSDPDCFHALKNVNFAIKDGESVAVIGANGAGKSTLLSLVTRLAPPSEGEVSIKGRVAALLELGAGFHPDLTGRENIRLNASLLGFSRRQARDLYETIVDFAELQDFIDEPLRTYSNGMILRLAFAVAVNLDPQILIIDEVLAVGDQQFQAKCIDKIFEIRNQGRTILCVSHATGILQNLCSRALWLDHGQLVMDGPISEVLQAYSGRTLHAASE